MRHLRFSAALAAMVIIVSACTGGGSSSSAAGSDGGASQAPASAGGRSARELVIGFVPSREADALVEDIQPLADYLTEALGIPVEGFVSTRLHRARDGDGDRPGADRRAAAVRAGPGRRRGRRRRHPAVGAQSAAPPTTPSSSPRTRTSTAPTTPVENDAPSRTRTMIAFLNCNGTARAFDESPEGPIGLEALENVEPGTPVSFVEQTSASGYIFPATVLSQPGHRPRDRHRAALRGRPRRLGHRGLRWRGRDRRQLRRCPHDRDTDCDMPRHRRRLRLRRRDPQRRHRGRGRPVGRSSQASIKQALLDLRRDRGGRGGARLDLQHHRLRRAEPRVPRHRPRGRRAARRRQ